MKLRGPPSLDSILKFQGMGEEGIAALRRGRYGSHTYFQISRLFHLVGVGHEVCLLRKSRTGCATPNDALSSSARPRTIDRGIERGIVVHFELSIKLEVASSLLNIAPQRRQTFSKILSLTNQHLETLLIAFDMRRFNIVALNLLPRVKNL